MRRPFEGVPGLPQSTEKSLSEIVQGGRFGSNIKTRQHTLAVRNFTRVHTVFAKKTFQLGTNMIDYKFGIHYPN